MDRPTLSDPKEYALIKKIYFDNDRPTKEDIDPLENLDRMESRSRNNNNQAR